jgi:hypothetical protein
MKDMQYFIGHKVRIITLIDGFGRKDTCLEGMVGKTGEVLILYRK